MKFIKIMLCLIISFAMVGCSSKEKVLFDDYTVIEEQLYTFGYTLTEEQEKIKGYTYDDGESISKITFFLRDNGIANINNRFKFYDTADETIKILELYKQFEIVTFNSSPRSVVDDVIGKQPTYDNPYVIEDRTEVNFTFIAGWLSVNISTNKEINK